MVVSSHSFVLTLTFAHKVIRRSYCTECMTTVQASELGFIVAEFQLMSLQAVSGVQNEDKALPWQACRRNEHTELKLNECRV